MIGRRVAPALRPPGYQPVKKRQVMGGIPSGGVATAQYPQQEEQGGGLLDAGLGLGLLGGKQAVDLLGGQIGAGEGLQPWFASALAESPEGLAPWMTDAAGANPFSVASSLAPGAPATDAAVSAAGGVDPVSMGAMSALNFGLGLGQGQEPWRALLGSVPFVGGFLGGLFD